jgi:hypothetical protein
MRSVSVYITTSPNGGDMITVGFGTPAAKTSGETRR